MQTPCAMQFRHINLPQSQLRAHFTFRLRLSRPCRQAGLLVPAASIKRRPVDYPQAAYCPKRLPECLLSACRQTDAQVYLGMLSARAVFRPRDRELSRTNAVTAPEQGIDSDVDGEPLEEKEQTRRMRISSANKGRVPWNKGRKHSPETIAKIRERTKIAMQRKEVIEKLKNAPHNKHSRETKAKISDGVRKVKAAQRVDAPPKEKKPAVRKRAESAEDFSSDSSTSSSSGLKGRTEAHRIALSEAIKRKWQDPEYRSKVISSMKRPETTEKRVKTQTRNGARTEITPKPRPSRVSQAAAKRAEGPHSSVRKMISLHSQQAREEQLLRDEMLRKARETVARTEQQLAALRSQMSALSFDPEKEEQAQQAQRLAEMLLAKANEQLAKLERLSSGNGMKAAPPAQSSNEGMQNVNGMSSSPDPEEPPVMETYINGFTDTTHFTQPPSDSPPVSPNGVILPQHTINGTSFEGPDAGTGYTASANSNGSYSGHIPLQNGSIKNGKIGDADGVP